MGGGELGGWVGSRVPNILLIFLDPNSYGLGVKVF